MGINLERQHVLTKKEKWVMRVIYQSADKKDGTCLISPIEIFEKLPLDIEYEEHELDTIMSNLAIDAVRRRANLCIASICCKKVLLLQELKGRSVQTLLSDFCLHLDAVFALVLRQWGLEHSSNILWEISDTFFWTDKSVYL